MLIFMEIIYLQLPSGSRVSHSACLSSFRHPYLALITISREAVLILLLWVHCSELSPLYLSLSRGLWSGSSGVCWVSFHRSVPQRGQWVMRSLNSYAYALFCPVQWSLSGPGIGLLDFSPRASTMCQLLWQVGNPGPSWCFFSVHSC